MSIYRITFPSGKQYAVQIPRQQMHRSNPEVEQSRHRIIRHDLLGRPWFIIFARFPYSLHYYYVYGYHVARRDGVIA